MNAKMHHVLLGRMAILLLSGGLLLFAAAPGAQTGLDTSALAAEIGSKDLGERGERIIPALDLSNAELSVVLRAIAKFSSLNIVAGEDVTGQVSLYLEDVDVRSALSAILATNGYGYISKDNVVYILPAEKLGEDKVKTITRVYFLQYLDAAEVEESLQDIFSQGGGSGGGGGGGSNTISSNPSSNSIIITDTPDQVEKVVALLAEIDRPFKQVQIEARLIEVRLGSDLEFGIDWLYFDEGSEQNRLDVNLTPLDKLTGMSQSAGMFQFGLIRDGGKTLSGFIQADEVANNVKILANPSVTVLHNTRAEIKITNDIPVVEANVSQGVITESVTYQETGITLEVTPRINDEGDIIMKVKPSQMIAGPRIILQNSSAFSIDRRSVETELRVPDAATFVIGGLRSSEMDKTRQKVPVLGDIPILGHLFSRKLDKMVQTDLLLFVTPTVVRDYALNDRQLKRYNEFNHINKELDQKVKEDEELRKKQEAKEQERQARKAEKERLRMIKEREQRERELEQRDQELFQDKSPDQEPAEPLQIEESIQKTDSKRQPTEGSRLTAFDWEGQWALAEEKESVGIIVQGETVVSDE